MTRNGHAALVLFRLLCLFRLGGIKGRGCRFSGAALPGTPRSSHRNQYDQPADRRPKEQHRPTLGGKEDHALGGIDQVLPAPAEGCGELFTECPGGRNGLIILDHLTQIEVQVRIGNLIVHPLEGGGQPLDLIADIGKRLFQRDDTSLCYQVKMLFNIKKKEKNVFYVKNVQT